MNGFRRMVFALMGLFLFLAPFAFAAEADIDKILEPVIKIKDLLVAGISVLAIIVILFSGVKFMTSGENIQAREGAKSHLTYAVIGLAVVWVAPLIVGYLTAPIA